MRDSRTADGSQPRCRDDGAARCFEQARRIPMKEFLVAIDGSEGGDAAIDEALELAHEVGAQVTFAFVRKPPSSLLGSPYYERLLCAELGTARAVTDAARRKAWEAGVGTRTEILEGDPVDEILSFADNRGADLIVMGSRG